MRSHEKVGPTRTRGGRKYADEVKPSEDAAATPIPLRRQIIYYLKTLSSPNISLIFEICFFATLLYRGKIFYHRFLYNDEKICPNGKNKIDFLHPIYVFFNQNCLNITLKMGKIMASSKEFLNFIVDQLLELNEISYRAMMGEYIIYYRDKVIGGIYDDRFLVKPVKAAKTMMPNASMELPYDGAKEMILVDNVEDSDFLCQLIKAIYEELPIPRKK